MPVDRRSLNNAQHNTCDRRRGVLVLPTLLGGYIHSVPYPSYEAANDSGKSALVYTFCTSSRSSSFSTRRITWCATFSSFNSTLVLGISALSASTTFYFCFSRSCRSLSTSDGSV